jgi:hypothetical protein
MPKLAQIEPPGVHFEAFLAWMPKLAQIEPPGVHFGAFLAWMPKLTRIEPPGVHFGAFLAGMSKITSGLDSKTHSNRASWGTFWSISGLKPTSMVKILGKGCLKRLRWSKSSERSA